MGNKDSLGKVFILLKIFLLNERIWMFHWIFNVVLHTIFSAEVMGRLILIISDGDQQECGSIDNVVGMFMKGAKRGWHIVNRNFNTKVLART